MHQFEATKELRTKLKDNAEMFRTYLTVKAERAYRNFGCKAVTVAPEGKRMELLIQTEAENVSILLKKEGAVISVDNLINELDTMDSSTIINMAICLSVDWDRYRDAFDDELDLAESEYKKIFGTDAEQVIHTLLR